MSTFEREGKNYWENFGKSIDFLLRLYFDFVNNKEYERFLEKYNLKNKTVIDLGAGYPTPPESSEEKLIAPLGSGLQEILERRGAKIIPVDIALEPLKLQKEKGREAVLSSIFQPPFKNESIDGGATILNIFNSSFSGDGGRETYIKPEECKKILQEAYRVLHKNTFAIVGNYGYLTAMLDKEIKILGPEEQDIITQDMIQKLAVETGFKNIYNIPLDPKRIELGEKFALESFPEFLRERISVTINNGNTFLIEK